MNEPGILNKRRVSDVALVDDNRMDRQLVSIRFKQSFEATRWREFDSGRTALDECLSNPPELMLLDLHLPDLDGLDVLSMLRNAGHTFQVVVMTSVPERFTPKDLMELNVNGFLDKGNIRQGLFPAVSSVMDGGLFFSASRTPSTETPVRRPAPRAKHPLLSEREQEVLGFVAHGFSSKQIAAKIGLSSRTVENHRARLMAKLELTNTADLVRWATRNGFA